MSVDFTDVVKNQVKALLEQELINRGISLDGLSSRALLCIHAELRYAGYIQKEIQEVEKLAIYQSLVIPAALDYFALAGLSKELAGKLHDHAPQTVAQAQLISGMTPAALSILIFQIRMHNKKIKNVELAG